VTADAMTYKLYNRLGSGGFVVEAALALAAAPFELVEIQSVPSTPLPSSFRDINPWGQVPVLITPDGTMMTESAAMLIHISIVHSDANVAPQPGTPAHAEFLRWCVFMSTSVYESILRISYPGRYTTAPAGTADIVDAAKKRSQDALSVIEQAVQPGGFLVSDSLSLADIYLAMLNAWNGEGKALPLCDDLTHRVASHPIIAPIWQRNFDHRLATKWGRKSN